MPRSSYIYVVIGVADLPRAAFTVKYECQDWIKKRGAKYVARFRDGTDTKEVIAVEDFMS